MKKTLVSLSLCALVAFGATSCKKDIEQNNGDYQFRATMENCSGDSKTTFNGTAIQWNQNDTVKIFGLVDGLYLATPEQGNPGAAKLRRIGEPVTFMGNEVTAIYPASLANSASSVTLPAVQESEDGNLISNFPMYATTSDENLAFKNLFGALKLHLQQADATVSRIEVTADVEINGNFDIDNSGEYPEVTYADGGSYTTTLICTTPQDITNGHDFFIAMPAGTYSNLTIKIQNAGYGVEKHSPEGATITIERSLYFTLGFQALNMPIPPDDGVWGLFSVSPIQQVWIAAGNLQYNKNLGSFTAPDGTLQNGTWRFAEHQWDFVGYGGNRAGTVEGSNNYSNASWTASSWVDQFQWGATGYNGLNPRPWIDTIANYPTMPATIAGTHYDWGVYCIPGWRTLSKDEWQYLEHGANRNGGSSKIAAATVNGVHGAILLPDIWNGPALPVAGINTSTSYNGNVFAAEQWAEYEAFGAAFLPVTNMRTGGNGLNSPAFQDGAYYWSATVATNGAWMTTISGNGKAFGGNPRPFNSMLSVRLVKNYVPAN